MNFKELESLVWKLYDAAYDEGFADGAGDDEVLKKKAWEETNKTSEKLLRELKKIRNPQ